MAKRLTVIISQSSMRHSQTADAEELLLTELMMAAGMDATLVGSLDQVQVDSTDHLCLSGSSGQTLAVVSSLTFQQVAQQWSRLQLAGQVVRMGQTGAMGQRRVIYFPLSSDTTATLRELRQLLVDQAVKTVEVIMPPGKLAPLSPREVPLANASAPQVASPPRSSQPLPAPAATQPPAAPLPAMQPAQSQVKIDEPWPALDRLVDDLDALDL